MHNFAREIGHVILVNSGVKLAVEGSEAMGQLRDLADMGVEILSCGTCLKHFGLQDRLRAGSISNIAAIFEVVKDAGRLISP